MRTGSRLARIAYLGRVAHIAAVLLRFYPLRWVVELARRLPAIGRRLAPAPTGARRFRLLLEELGGSFIKFGQVLSLQPDLVPAEYCDELFDLLDKVPPFEFEEVERIFLEDLGKSPHEIFDRFESHPFASASIGQVHRASLDGSDLAVKVRRPTAMRDFGGDIKLMRAAVWLISRLRIRKLEAYCLPINEFIAWTSDELDYRTEARYMEQVGRNTRNRRAARVPAIIRELSTSRILTAEFLHGTTLLEYLRSREKGDPAVDFRITKLGFVPEEFAENVVRNFIGDVFRHGLFHADLHPANLLILPGNVVGYVDFGITGIISSYGRRHVLALILALARRDVDEWLTETLKISEVTDKSDVEGFRRGVRAAANGWFEQRRGSRRLTKSYTLIVLDMIRLSRDFEVLPHEEALRYMRSVITADGLIDRFAPNYDIGEALERLTRGHLRDREMKTTFSADRMIEAWIAGAGLMRDGSLRLDRLLDRLEREVGRERKRGQRAGRSGRTSLGSRIARVGAVILVLTVLVLTEPEPRGLGLDPVTAEVSLIGAATAVLGWNVLRWLRSPR